MPREGCGWIFFFEFEEVGERMEGWRDVCICMFLLLLRV